MIRSVKNVLLVLLCYKSQRGQDFNAIFAAGRNDKGCGQHNKCSLFTRHNALPLDSNVFHDSRKSNKSILEICERLLCGNVLYLRAELHALSDTIYGEQDPRVLDSRITSESVV